jgi:hypothetical protein
VGIWEKVKKEFPPDQYGCLTGTGGIIVSIIDGNGLVVQGKQEVTASQPQNLRKISMRT